MRQFSWLRFHPEYLPQNSKGAILCLSCLDLHFIRDYFCIILLQYLCSNVQARFCQSYEHYSSNVNRTLIQNDLGPVA